jgi:hypothetical protein
VNSGDTIPLTFLALQGLALVIGAILLVWMIGLFHRRRAAQAVASRVEKFPAFRLALGSRPTNWLAVRSIDPQAVQAALGLAHFAPCPWAEGMMGEHEFFIGPPVNGWIIVTGSGLPNPGHDVDQCFYFLMELSRKFGRVQFFQADRIFHHHAWARVENGGVIRAYAWAGETVWNQGAKTPAETELSMKCFGYGEQPDADSWAAAAWTAANVTKVPLLAARWSLDPARIDERLRHHADGVAGESPGRAWF